MSRTESEAPAGARRLRLRIGGLHCGACAENVERALRRAEGVLEARVEFENGRGAVLYDPAATGPQRLLALPVFCGDAGFRVRVVEGEG